MLIDKPFGLPISVESAPRLMLPPNLGIDAQDRLSGDLRRAGIPVLLLHDDSYEDIFRNLVAIGTITGHRDAAIALVAEAAEVYTRRGLAR